MNIPCRKKCDICRDCYSCGCGKWKFDPDCEECGVCLPEERKIREELLYVSGPYRAESLYQIAENINKAKRIGMKFWKQGYAVITPHLNTQYMDGFLPSYRWLIGDLVMIQRSDVIALLKNWRKSKGARIEAIAAVLCGLKILEENEEGCFIQIK